MATSTIALFKHHPECSKDSCDGIVQSLSKEYQIKYFNEKDNLYRVLQDATVVAFPGGIGDADRYYDFFKRRSANIIADFVESGGHYLGICMGAYWADRYYFDILNNVRAVQYIKSPNTDTKRPHPKAIDITWQGTQDKMYFYDGCAFTGHGSYETVATYANGDPMAIIQNRVGLIGCHPESDEFWYDSYSYMKGKYHNGSQHNTLLYTVNRFMGIGI